MPYEYTEDYHKAEITPGYTDARYAGDSSLWVQFGLEPMPDDEASAKEGRPIFKEVEHIKIMQPGNKESIILRPVTDLDRGRFRKQYENWKSGHEDLIEGTPLEQWPAVTRAQVEELKHFNVRTVEQLADISDAHAQKFMGINSLRRLAQEYINKGKEGALSTQMIEALKAKDNQIAALQEALNGLQAQVAELNKKGA